MHDDFAVVSKVNLMCCGVNSIGSGDTVHCPR